MATNNVNSYEFVDDTVVVSTHGIIPEKFTIDKADFPIIRGRCYYIVRHNGKPMVMRTENSKPQGLIRDLLGETCPAKPVVRYVDGNTLNCRRCNIRIFGAARSTESVLSGVQNVAHGYGTTYRAYVNIDDGKLYVGNYDTERRAVYAVLVAREAIPTIVARDKLDERRRMFTHSMLPAEKERVRATVLAAIPSKYLGDNVRRGSKHAK